MTETDRYTCLTQRLCTVCAADRESEKWETAYVDASTKLLAAESEIEELRVKLASAYASRTEILTRTYQVSTRLREIADLLFENNMSGIAVMVCRCATVLDTITDDTVSARVLNDLQQLWTKQTEEETP